MPAPLGLVLDSTFSLANDDRQMSSGHWSLPPSSEAVSSTLSVGVIQRGDVDTTYTCLASNSNMTQASRATLHLQMNRKPFHFFAHCNIYSWLIYSFQIDDWRVVACMVECGLFVGCLFDNPVKWYNRIKEEMIYLHNSPIFDKYHTQ